MGEKSKLLPPRNGSTNSLFQPILLLWAWNYDLRVKKKNHGEADWFNSS